MLPRLRVVSTGRSKDAGSAGTCRYRRG